MKFIKPSAFALIVSIAVLGAPLTKRPPVSASSAGSRTASAADGSADWLADPATGVFVYCDDGKEVRCRPADAEEAAAIGFLDDRAGLKVIQREGPSLQAAGEITIVLRGTPQLDAFPAAKNGFLAAADHWKAKLQTQTPVTIVIDVDFGPTSFGQPFHSGVLGATMTQSLINTQGYGSIRNALVSRANSAAESTLYSSLPSAATGVPTDIGAVSGFVAPSALLRALGMISPVADPSAEQSSFGNPPAIGFNSSFEFDFDPSNGIDPDKVDFDTVATHEIGHALGFVTRMGQLELTPSAPPAVTVWDLFRFRPGATLNNFAAAQRILSSGGQQSYFDGGPELPLSTGRPDQTGGDGFQGSHWKNDTFVGFVVGIMDPAVARGEREEIANSDLRALDAFGYGTRAGGSSDDAGDPGGPIVNKASYNGEQMTIKGDAFSGTLQLEVNGVVVAPPLRIKVKGSGSKLKITGSQSELNLRSGSNRVRVIGDGKRSAVVLLNL